MRPISRRSFLKTGLGAAAALSFPQGLLTPLSQAATHGVKELHLSSSRSKVSLGRGPEFWAWTFNGRVPGPEIRVREGETLRVVLKNFLPEETSIHWHGVPVPNAMDGVPGVTQKGVQSGETFVYEFEAKPAGTYIYHSHARYQLDQGLYGALIIEPPQSLQSHDREYTLLLEDWVMKDEGGIAATRRRSSMGMMHGRMGRRRPSAANEPLLEPIYGAYAVNGRISPEELVVKQGDRVKLRIANPSSATIYDLRLAGHTLVITHVDGRPIEPFKTDVLRIGMGERYDVEFLADNPGFWLMSAYERGWGEGQIRIPVRYKGTLTHDPTPPRFHARLRFATYWDFRAKGSQREIVPTSPDRFFPQTLSGGMHSPYWGINGQFYPDAESLTVRTGDRVRMGYWNHSMMPHPMHLHGHFFRLVHPNHPNEHWIYKDTVLVNPMERVEIEFIADNPGRWFHHCHNLYHMMAGMANVVEVG